MIVIMNEVGSMSQFRRLIGNTGFVREPENQSELHCEGADTMQDNTKYVGLDTSKDTIAIAVADAGRDAPRSWGVIPNTPEAIRKLIRKLGQPEDLDVCYEAGPLGYGLQRMLTQMGVKCSVIAPSLIPSRPGDRVKTDRRDAIKLAHLHRAGELTAVYVPNEDDEALRDLVRCREDAKEDLLRARQRMSKFLLRHDLTSPAKMTKWKSKYMAWLQQLKFSNRALQQTHQEYLHAIIVIAQRIERLEKEIHELAMKSPHKPVIQALQTLRGVKELTAVTLVVEVGDFRRFTTARQFMGYTGLIPSESSSGPVRRQGKVTKTGNTHLRRVLVEAAWSYRYRPALRGDIRKRQEGQSPSVQSISWKAQDRLHRKYLRLLSRGKPSTKAIVALARELAGFVWAISKEEMNSVASN
ncbi:IS110 family transposase [Alicyclobacillus sp. SO9]|uniref:IS110 family transposase n=2 Tax=Alicyclobacillus sp. SO9 TaxID=2665646 RepID=UPI001E328D4A|nr:IS110 family transposase [Alicyclobacillus sp. SO9]